MTQPNVPGRPGRSLARRSRCGCGRHADQAEHDRLVTGGQGAGEHGAGDYRSVVAEGVLRAAIPDNTERRGFLRAVGMSTALAALSQVLGVQARRPVKVGEEFLVHEPAGACA